MRAIIFLSVAIFFAGCKNTESNNQISASENIVSLTKAQLQSAALTFVQPEIKQVAGTITVNGKIDVPPQNLVSVSVPLGGFLKTTKLLPGMHITKGEVIAVLEDEKYIQLQQDYLNAKAKLSLTELEFNRQKQLNETKAVSDKVFEQAKLEYQSAQINVSTLSEKLKLIHIDPNSLNEKNISRTMNIYAPFAGFVSKVNFNIGKYINPADVLFELVDPTDIHLKLQVFEKDIAALEIGQKILAYTNAQPLLKHKGEIILISKDISPDNTAEVHCHFDKYDKTLFPGMFMNADIEIQNKQSLTLPETAIVNFEGKNYCFVKIDEQKFEQTELKTGENKNGAVEILNANAIQNKSIVNGGVYALLMALKNKPEAD
jgi:cobalt-zinc-cadmium efflux system membrane fusion protein